MELVKRGKRGNDVREIQEMLISQGYLDDRADGVFGRKTEQAVLAFQRDHGLDETGIVYGQGVSGTWYQKDFSQFLAGYTDDPLMQKKQYDEEVRRLCAFLHDGLQITDLSLSE